jgi:HEPN domain-containing protein
MAKQTNSVTDWRELFDRDMAVAEHLTVSMHPVPTAIIIFLCQQGVEKYLKGALVFLGEEPPYIHDLEELCARVEKHRPSFGTIFTLCSVITHFAIQPRYDKGMDNTEADMQITM